MKRIITYTAAVAAILFTSCRKQEAEPQLPLPTSKEITFKTYLEENGQIHPIEELKTRSAEGDPLSAGYYLSGVLTTLDYPSTATSNTYTNLMRDIETNKDGSFKNNTTTYFWAAGTPAQRHTFLAYSAPPSGLTGPTPGSLAGGTKSQPLFSIAYTHDDDPAKQIDFLYSDNAKNRVLMSQALPVSLIFRHRFTRVVFKIIGPGGLMLNDCDAQITYSTRAVKRAGTVVLGDNASITYTTTTASYHTGTHALNNTPFTVPGSAITSDQAIEIGDMILMPQQSLTTGWASVTLTYIVEGTPEKKSASVELSALNMTATAGQQLEIMLGVMEQNLNLSVVGVTLKNWSSKNGHIDADPTMKITKPNPPTDDQTLVIDNLRWAKGNLIAVDEYNCAVGGPRDHGLYFKFGSLVGWRGGASGNGTGTSTNGMATVVYTTPSLYNGAISWAGVLRHNSSTAVPIPVNDNTVTAVGDPCRFYLGEPWRTPTSAEFAALKYSTWTTNTSIYGVWAAATTPAADETNSLYFTCPGMRNLNTGVTERINTEAGYLSADFASGSTNKALWFGAASNIQTPKMDSWDGRRAYPVRCVRPK